MKSSKVVVAVLLFLAGPAWAGVSMKGVSSVLSAPLLKGWTLEYSLSHPGVKWNLDVKDSTDAANQWLGRGASFAAVDTPLTDGQEKRALGRVLVPLPVAMEAVAITYNLPGIPTGLKMTPSALSDIFLGRIRKWNDPAIAASNPGVSLPDMDIRVVHREDESSRQDFFPYVLSRLDPQWTLKREREKNLHWPVGRNEKGDQRVEKRMRLWPGVIAALDYPYAAQHHLPMAALRNEAGSFVAPDADSIQASASDLLNLPADFIVHLRASRDKKAYPLSTFAWLWVYRDLGWADHDARRNRALVDFLEWVLSDGQKQAADLSYVPLPERFLPGVRQEVDGLKY